MWLGMLSGALGQIPGAPVEPLTWLGGLCAGFIGWVAHALGPEWAQLDVPEPGPAAALVWTAVLVGGARLACLALERRRALVPAPRPPQAARDRRGRRPRERAPPRLGSIASGDGPPGRPPALTIRILDVGQGDAILVQPRGRLAAPHRHGPARRRRGRAPRRPRRRTSSQQSRSPTTSSTTPAALRASSKRWRWVASSPPTARPGAAVTSTVRQRRGSRRGRASGSGAARAEVLWPPPSAPPAAESERDRARPQAHAGRLRRPPDGGRRGGGRDLRLRSRRIPEGRPPRKRRRRASSRCSAATSPELAAISVGADNTYGHPAPETTAALEAHDVPLLRTDRRVRSSSRSAKTAGASGVREIDFEHRSAPCRQPALSALAGRVKNG